MSDAGYAQRTDLLAPKAAPGQTYGEAGRQIQAQRAVPMGNPTPAAPPQPRVAPGAAGPLTRPTERPEEPITQGAPFGAGRTPIAPGYSGPRTADPILSELRALYALNPNEALADMIDSYIREGY
jgi:hypothetical protein